MALPRSLTLPFALVAALLAGPSLVGQQETEKPAPTKPVTEETAETAAKIAQQDPAVRAAQLRDEITKVERELAFIRSILEQGGLLARIRP
jgi:hypothetical protein